MGGETMHGQTRGDMWMNALLWRHVVRHLEPCGACEQGWNVCKCARKYAVWRCSVHICPCLSLSPCVVVSWCGTLKTTVCTFKTSPCVTAPRAHVETHERVMLVQTETLRTYTRGRFECTHGGSSSVLLANSCPRGVITCFRGSPKKLLDLTHFQFENRSRTTCSQFHHSFALPGNAVQSQQSWGKLWRESATGWFDWSLSFSSPSSLLHHNHHNTTHNTQRLRHRDRDKTQV